MTNDKLPTPGEFKQELQLSVKGEGQFINDHKQPSGKAARHEWQRIISEMSNEGLSKIEKKNWMEGFLNEVKGTRIVSSFPKLVVHINGQYERLSKMVEEDQLIRNNTSTDHLTSNKNVEPWDRIDNTAKQCINLFIDENRFTGNNAEIVKGFLVSFEIRSQEEYGEPHLGKVDPTVDEVIKHDTYPYNQDAIGKRTLINRLDDYWDNYRDPGKMKTK